jgi:hypothetical protein
MKQRLLIFILVLLSAISANAYDAKIQKKKPIICFYQDAAICAGRHYCLAAMLVSASEWQ